MKKGPKPGTKHTHEHIREQVEAELAAGQTYEEIQKKWKVNPNTISGINKARQDKEQQ